MKKQRLIDADEFAKRIITERDIAYQQKRYEISSVITEVVAPILAGMPTIEDDPVRHGDWILDFLSPYRRNHYKCSVCGKRSANASLYCHNCGAKMDGDST